MGVLRSDETMSIYKIVSKEVVLNPSLEEVGKTISDLILDGYTKMTLEYKDGDLSITSIKPKEKVNDVERHQNNIDDELSERNRIATSSNRDY